MAYSDKVIDHCENPRNVGSMDSQDDNVGTGLVGAPACGDVMRLQIQVSDEGVIEDAKGVMWRIDGTEHLTEGVLAEGPVEHPMIVLIGEKLPETLAL